MKILRASALVATLVAVAGCAAETGADEHAGTVRQAVLGGSASPAGEDFVVQLAQAITAGNQKVWSARCTGTLVSERLVLTSKACVETLEIGVYVGAGARGAVEARPQPAPASLVDHAVMDPKMDVAVLVLKTAISGKPVASLRLDGPAVKGEKLTVVGYGDAKPPAPRSHRAGVAVTRASNTGFEVTDSACEDDQGGPALAGTDGVVGVATLVALCDGSGGATFTTLASARTSIEEAFASVNATPRKAAAPKSSGTSSTDSALGDEGDGTAETVQDGDDPESDPLASSGCAVARTHGPARGGGLALLAAIALFARRTKRGGTHRARPASDHASPGVTGRAPSTPARTPRRPTP